MPHWSSSVSFVYERPQLAQPLQSARVREVEETALQHTDRLLGQLSPEFEASMSSFERFMALQKRQREKGASERAENATVSASGATLMASCQSSSLSQGRKRRKGTTGSPRGGRTQSPSRRALAAHTHSHPLPAAVQRAAATARAAAAALRAFALEMPHLTPAEGPAAATRLSALVLAQTVAAADVERLAAEELAAAAVARRDVESRLAEALAALANASGGGGSMTASGPSATATTAQPAVTGAHRGPQPGRLPPVLAETMSWRSLYTMLTPLVGTTRAASALILLKAPNDAPGQTLGTGVVTGVAEAAAASLSVVAAVGGARVSATTAPLQPPPADLMEICGAVLLTRCAANLHPRVAPESAAASATTRRATSFRSLLVVPIFSPSQPAETVLGVLVLENKRPDPAAVTKLAPSHSAAVPSPLQDLDGMMDDGRSSHYGNVPFASTTTSGTSNAHQGVTASTAALAGGGFTVDDEHRAATAAEMLGWLLERVPLGIGRGASQGGITASDAAPAAGAAFEPCLSPAGFSAEWQAWTGLPLEPSATSATWQRRRFVFRTEDPREAAAAAAGAATAASHGAASAAASALAVLAAAGTARVSGASRRAAQLQKRNAAFADTAVTGALLPPMGDAARARHAVEPSDATRLVDVAATARGFESAAAGGAARADLLAARVAELEAALEGAEQRAAIAQRDAGAARDAAARTVRRILGASVGRLESSVASGGAGVGGGGSSARMAPRPPTLCNPSTGRNSGAVLSIMNAAAPTSVSVDATVATASSAASSFAPVPPSESEQPQCESVTAALAEVTEDSGAQFADFLPRSSYAAPASAQWRR